MADKFRKDIENLGYVLRDHKTGCYLYDPSTGWEIDVINPF